MHQFTRLHLYAMCVDFALLQCRLLIHIHTHTATFAVFSHSTQKFGCAVTGEANEHLLTLELEIWICVFVGACMKTNDVFKYLQPRTVFKEKVPTKLGMHVNAHTQRIRHTKVHFTPFASCAKFIAYIFVHVLYGNLLTPICCDIYIFLVLWNPQF